MWSSPLLALLLFTVVAHTTALPPPTVPNRTLPYPHPFRSPRASASDVDELMANGGKYMLKSYNGRYLSRYVPGMQSCYLRFIYTTDRPYIGAPEQWTFVRLNDYEVAIKDNHCGRFIRYYRQDTLNVVDTVSWWEMWTPIKNTDGTWSFTTKHYGGWMSAHLQASPTDRMPRVVMQPENLACEKWTLEPWN